MATKAEKTADRSGRLIVLMDVSKVATAKQQTAQLVADSQQFQTITNSTECVSASTFLAKVARARRFVKNVFQLAKAPLVDQKRAIDTDEKTTVATLLAIEASLTKGIQEFRIREAETRAKIDDEERRQREDAARVEQAAKAEELRQAALAAPNKKVARMLTQQATIIENAQPIIDPIEAQEPEQTLAPGVFDRTTYHGSIRSFERLVLQVAAELMMKKFGAPPTVALWLKQFNPNAQASLSCLQPSMPTINELATRLKNDLSLEGVTVEKDTNLVAR